MLLLNPTPLIAIKVPLGASNFIHSTGDLVSYTQIVNGQVQTKFITVGCFSHFKSTIIGVVDALNMDFDPTPHLEGLNIRVAASPANLSSLDVLSYRNYTSRDQFKDSYSNSFDSFRSLLQFHKLFFHNPYINKPVGLSSYGLSLQLERWSSAERSLLTGSLLIIKNNS